MSVCSPQPFVLTSQTLASACMLSNHYAALMSCASSLTCRCIRIETKMQVLIAIWSDDNCCEALHLSCYEHCCMAGVRHAYCTCNQSASFLLLITLRLLLLGLFLRYKLFRDWQTLQSRPQSPQRMKLNHFRAAACYMTQIFGWLLQQLGN